MAAAASRRTVTVLFCDLVGSTALGARLDPEALRTLLGRWHGEMAAAVEYHGGTVEKFIGDALMAVFGFPHVHEDDALRSVRAALEMRARIDELNRRLAPAEEPLLRVRIGINSGEVVAGEGATSLVTGDAVNVAKRLEEAAGTDEILIGSQTRLLVENAVELQPRREVAAKGKTEAIAAWPVRGAIDGAEVFARRLDAPLVGRSRELGELRAAFEDARRERACRLATVVGAAGVGKSRLARELIGALRPEARVLTGRCVAYGDGLTFLPLLDLLDSVGGVEAAAHAVHEEPDAALISERIRAAADPASGQSTDETFWAVRRLLEALARSRPLVVCIEDAHWAEPTFLDLLEYLAGWSGDAPMLVLCLARPDLFEARPRWGGQTVRLEQLSDAESHELLSALASEWPVPAAAVADIAEAAEGNPLFVEQMVAMVAQTGKADIPPTINAVLAARLDQLHTEERAVVERAAVAGRDFLRSAVWALTPEEGRSSVGSTLLALVRKELVQPQRTSATGDDGFRFRHALIRDAAYAGIPKAARAELHARYAEHLAAEGLEDELVGYHLEQAYRCRADLGERDEQLAARAAALLAAAGQRAYVREDMPAAANLLERALDLAPIDGNRAALLRALGAARWRTGALAGATDATETAIAVAVETGDRREEWYGRLDQAARRLVQRGGGDDLENVVREAIRVFAELDDDRGLARAWRRLALVSMSEWQFSAAARHAETALVHARQAGDATEDAGLADVLCTVLMFGAEHAAAAERRCRSLLVELQATQPVVAAVSSTLACLVAMQGRFEEARELAREAGTIYDRLGLRLPRAGLAEVAAMVESLAGDSEAAEQELRHAFDVFVDAGMSPLAGYHAARLARLSASRGRIAAADDHLAFARRHCDRADRDSRVELQLAEATVALLHDRRGEALDHADQVLALVADTEHLLYRAETLALRAEIVGEEPTAALELYARKGNVAAAGRLRTLATQRAPR